MIMGEGLTSHKSPPCEVLKKRETKTTLDKEAKYDSLILVLKT